MTPAKPGQIITATDGRRYHVLHAHPYNAGASTATGAHALLGLRLDSPRARATYTAAELLDGRVIVTGTI